MTRLAVAVGSTRLADVCDPATRRLLEERFDVRWAPGEQVTPEELPELIGDAEVVLTSWGTPPLTTELLQASSVSVIAHAAGTVKSLLPTELVGSRLTVFSAATRIAWSVGEYCLAACLMVWRRLPGYDTAVRDGRWRQDTVRGDELRGRRIGIIGASSTARAFIELLRPFGCEIVVYDPYLTADDAARLGVRSVELSAAMSSPIVSVHVPNLPGTRAMITADLLAHVPDAGLVINSSRAAAIDTDALTREVVSGRIRAVMDVFEPEPAQLPAELLASPDVVLTPHIAGDSDHGHLALTRFVIDDVIAFLDTGRPGRSWVDPSRLAIAA